MEERNYKPSFCSIFYPAISSHQLRICPAFCKRYLRINTTSVLGTSSMFLMGPDGRQWKVQLLQSEGRFFFAKGWEEFNIFHCLIVGDFLVFEYDRYRSCFYVLIYDVTGCEKKIRPRKDLQLCKAMDENDDVLVRNASFPVKVKQEEEEDDNRDREHEGKEVNRNVDSKKNKGVRVRNENNSRAANLEQEKKRKRKQEEEAIKKDVDNKKNKKAKTQKKDDSGAANLVRANKRKRKEQVDNKKNKMQRAQKKTNGRAAANLSRGNKIKKKEVEEEHEYQEEKRQQNVDTMKNEKTRPQTKNHGKMILVTTGKDAIKIEKAQAAANSFQSKCPFFVVSKLNRTAYKGNRLRVPNDFAKVHIPKPCVIRLQIKKERKTWPVNLIAYNTGGKLGRYLCGGWRKFVNNNLQKDDALVFEMVNCNEFVVHIFRVMENY